MDEGLPLAYVGSSSDELSSSRHFTGVAFSLELSDWTGSLKTIGYPAARSPAYSIAGSLDRSIPPQKCISYCSLSDSAFVHSFSLKKKITSRSLRPFTSIHLSCAPLRSSMSYPKASVSRDTQMICDGLDRLLSICREYISARSPTCFRSANHFGIFIGGGIKAQTLLISCNTAGEARNS